MNERIQALRGRLPNGMLRLISMYDSHPTADLMKAVKIVRWGRQGLIPSGMVVGVEAPHYLIIRIWGRMCERIWYFSGWKYNPLGLPDWAFDEYIDEQLAAWMDR